MWAICGSVGLAASAASAAPERPHKSAAAPSKDTNFVMGSSLPVCGCWAGNMSAACICKVGENLSHSRRKRLLVSNSVLLGVCPRVEELSRVSHSAADRTQMVGAHPAQPAARAEQHAALRPAAKEPRRHHPARAD